MILDTDRITYDDDYRAEIDHRCITDHFFLAELLGDGFTLFNRRIHQPVADLYFPKNRNLPIAEQHPIKNRLHLDPRHTFKTTFGRVDSLQWILAFPEQITILNETATQPLAMAISEAISSFFYLPKGGSRTLLQNLYPHLVVTRKPDAIWNTPVRAIGQVDNTLAFTSPKTAQSGWHPWVECIDDMVDTINSGIHADDDVRRSVIDTYYTNKNTLRHGGYINLRGTRYHPFELYGDVIQKMDPDEWKVLIRSSLLVKSGKRLLPGEFPDEDDVILLFPEIPGMDYKGLRRKFYDDYESFMCQQQNDPQGGNIATFDEPLYQTMQIPAEKIPILGDAYVCWRLAYQGKQYMAHQSEGVAARVLEGKVYITDAWAGNYTPSRLAEKIVRECKRHQTSSVILEALPGIQYIEVHIRDEAARKNYPIHIQWIEFQEDDNERNERIRNLEPQARSGRILLSTGTGKAAELRSQFLNFGISKTNGIIDCISRLASKVPISLLRQEIDEEEAELQQKRRHQLIAQFVYGYQGGMENLDEKRRREIQASADAFAKGQSFGLTDILGGLDG